MRLQASFYPPARGALSEVSGASSHQQSGRLMVEASLWSADRAHLAAEVERIRPYADVFHLDATDSRFVATPSPFRPQTLAWLKARSTVPFHVHLMVGRPTEHVMVWAEAGADLITVHAGATAGETGDVLGYVRSESVRTGLAWTLDDDLTDPSTLAMAAELADVVIMIGTPLGTKGTSMSAAAPARIRTVRDLLDRHGGQHVPIIADGGIRTGTVPLLAEAGAAGVVAGSLLFDSGDPARTVAWLHRQGRPCQGGLPDEGARP
jgi:ribulose-phosphate 3-epimerase